MQRRTLPPAAALIASAVLLLTACGPGGGDDSSPDGIKGADTGASSSPSASASAASGVKRPTIKLPASFQVSFEGWTNSDPRLQAVMDDGRERLLGTYAGVTDQNPNADYIAFYNEGTALTTAQKWVKGLVDEDLTLVGKGRAFDPQVRISPDGSGTLFYCVDEGKGSTKNLKTGEVTKTPADDAFVLYQTKLRKEDGGVWKTTTVTTRRGGCR
ncbi:hypothetical protein N4P33_03950 [Streptomyces sp. 15-116A]|uniref:hypothetical protein n=1 Tax=Streptomyces sp. 15-116A TaxID=2259035 RepID=UPI0021B4B406|nr:hypothetical protein [Streptomyces sp. 15-116A]MCT7351321.1 hypothetical protein [Streptomyces sp. 15-116A]